MVKKIVLTTASILLAFSSAAQAVEDGRRCWDPRAGKEIFCRDMGSDATTEGETFNPAVMFGGLVAVGGLVGLISAASQKSKSVSGG